MVMNKCCQSKKQIFLSLSLMKKAEQVFFSHMQLANYWRLLAEDKGIEAELFLLSKAHFFSWFLSKLAHFVITMRKAL